MLEPIRERGLCGWQSAEDGSEGGKYEVCVLTGGEMTKAKMMSGCYNYWHSTHIFPLSRHFTAPSCRQQQPPCMPAQTFNLHLSKTCLIQPGTALAKHPVFVDCIWQMRFFKAWWSILQWLHWTDLPTPSKPWLGTGKGSSHSNPLLKPGNHVPIHQYLSQSRVDAKITPPSWGWWEANMQAG